MNLIINARREGYSLDQCGSSISVGELIEILKQYNENTMIYVSNDKGYTYGPIYERDIKVKREEN